MMSCFSSSLVIHHSSFVLLHHFYQMRNALDHSTYRRVIRPFRHSMHLSEAEGFQRLARFPWAADSAPHLLHPNHFFLALLRAHAASPPSSVPRRFLNCSSLRSCLRASKVA